jgi:hypothetical protein
LTKTRPGPVLASYVFEKRYVRRDEMDNPFKDGISILRLVRELR